MTKNLSFLSNVTVPEAVVTAIPSSPTFPEFLKRRNDKYNPYIDLFANLVIESSSSAVLLEKIRDNTRFNADERMSLLKIFRRAVSPIIDTEKSKKLNIATSVFIEHYGHTFKDIDILKRQFLSLPDPERSALNSLLGEYDDRGKQGYILTDLFFTWFENRFQGVFTIEGPRGAGRDIQLSTAFPDFNTDYPCDFIIRDAISHQVLVVGFARYDSTRGGSQSDDRTGGNNDKVLRANEFKMNTENRFKLLFLSDGPGLTHKDTWLEACLLDGASNDQVRVSTLKTAELRISEDWIRN